MGVKLIALVLLLSAEAGFEDMAGRVVHVAESPDERVGAGPMVAPGAPPLLSFRAYEGKLHQHLGTSDLMLDDAGH